MGIFRKLFGKKEEKQDLWSSYYGLPNDENLLEEKAAAFAPVLVHFAKSSQESLRKELEKDINVEDSTNDYKGKITIQKWDNAFHEFVFLFLHVTDRLAFEYLSTEQRSTFMYKLLVHVFFTLNVELKPKEPELRKKDSDAFITTNNERQQNYAQYKKMFPQKNESVADTLFWEFGEFISNILTDEQKDARVIMTVQLIIIPNMLSLQLPQLLTGKKHKTPF